MCGMLGIIIFSFFGDSGVDGAVDPLPVVAVDGCSRRRLCVVFSGRTYGPHAMYVLSVMRGLSLGVVVVGTRTGWRAHRARVVWWSGWRGAA